MPQQTDNDPRFLLVDESVLPEVFAKVVEAKDLLRSGRASTAAQAARLAGISRTAFYKYRDAVFSYDAGKSGGRVTVHLSLQDNPGGLSALLAGTAIGIGRLAPGVMALFVLFAGVVLFLLE